MDSELDVHAYVRDLEQHQLSPGDGVSLACTQVARRYSGSRRLSSSSVGWLEVDGHRLMIMGCDDQAVAAGHGVWLSSR